MGEHILRRALTGLDLDVDSVGVHAEHGMDADPVVVRLLEEKGFKEIQQHRSKPLVSGMIAAYDLFLCMEQHHLDEIKSMNAGVTGRAYLFGHWSGLEITDPHRQSEDRYLETLGLIEQSAEAWKQKLPMLGLV